MAERASHSPAPFEPVFVVGGKRSGTTLLATLLDRHSQIAVPPETHFFAHFRHRLARDLGSEQHRDLVGEFFANQRARDMKLDPERLLGRFRQYPADPAHLLRASLEEYAARFGKPRSGEKTPEHIEFVPTILQWFPRAKIVCIVRDGRAAVLSAARLGWRNADIVSFSLMWRQRIRWMLAWERLYSASFTRVSYEDLLRDPAGTLDRVDRFVGIQFEASQLDTSVATQAIPEWETKWKAKAATELDLERLSAWRREATDEEIWLMNLLMGKYLHRLDYPDASPSGRMSPRLLRYVAARFAQAARASGPVRTQLRRLSGVVRVLKS